MNCFALHADENLPKITLRRIRAYSVITDLIPFAGGSMINQNSVNTSSLSHSVLTVIRQKVVICKDWSYVTAACALMYNIPLYLLLNSCYRFRCRMQDMLALHINDLL